MPIDLNDPPGAGSEPSPGIESSERSAGEWLVNAFSRPGAVRTNHRAINQRRHSAIFSLRTGENIDAPILPRGSPESCWPSPLAGCGDSAPKTGPSRSRGPIPRRLTGNSDTMSKNMNKTEAATTKPAEKKPADNRPKKDARQEAQLGPTRAEQRSDRPQSSTAGRAWPPLAMP